nr:hypothetical protein CFP56_64007 [Quercus suber]
MWIALRRGTTRNLRGFKTTQGRSVAAVLCHNGHSCSQVSASRHVGASRHAGIDVTQLYRDVHNRNCGIATFVDSKDGRDFPGWRRQFELAAYSGRRHVSCFPAWSLTLQAAAKASWDVRTRSRSPKPSRTIFATKIPSSDIPSDHPMTITHVLGSFEEEEAAALSSYPMLFDSSRAAERI